MAINNINIGTVANDGTGDPVRSAFTTVNENFSFVQAGLFAGTEPSIISAVSVTGGFLYSNSYIYATTYVNANSIVSGTVTSNGNLFVSQQGAYIIGNVAIVGNLSVTGSQIVTQATNSTAPIVLLHANAAPYTINDLKDIGLEWQYYDGSDKYGFFGRQNTTGTLVYLDDITDVANVITTGTFGNVQYGQLLLSNTQSSTSNVTGALQVRGGVGIQGNVFIQSNVFIGNAANIGNLTVRGNVVGPMYFAGGTDTIFIAGSPVQTAANAFNGGPVGLATIFNDTTQSTSAISGAVQVRGGLGVAGNVFVANLQSNVGGNVRANVQGNIFTAAQPYITSLGTLTGLDVNGQVNANDISPNSNNTYMLGTGTSDRWSTLWVFDVNMSGTLTGGTVNSTGGTHTGNIAINSATAAALTSTTAVGEIFESGPATIRIGGGGVTEFRNSTESTSTSTGAIVVTGGVGIGSNLFVGGNLSVGATGASSVGAGVFVTDLLDLFATNIASRFGKGNTQSGTGIVGWNRSNIGEMSFVQNKNDGSTGGFTFYDWANTALDTTTQVFAITGTGNVIVYGNITPNANVTYNLGSPTTWFNTFYGVSTQAQYADLAENYVADADYQLGTVVVFGGEQEITVTDTFADARVAGVISSNPAYLMNAAAQGLPVALRGRVPVKIIGAVSKGDLLVTSAQSGFAQSVGQSIGFGHAVFAKSLMTDGRNGSKIIEAVII